MVLIWSYSVTVVCTLCKARIKQNVCVLCVQEVLSIFIQHVAMVKAFWAYSNGHNVKISLKETVSFFSRHHKVPSVQEVLTQSI